LTNYQANESSINVSANGLLWARGGTIVTHRVTNLAQVNIDGLSIFATRTVDTRSGMQGILRNFETYNNDFTFHPSRFVQDKGFILRSSALIETLSFTVAYFEYEIRNFDASKNANEYDIGHAADGRFAHRDWIITNSSTGSNVKGVWRNTTGSGAQKVGKLGAH
jgi:hypothetical protein